MQRMAKVAMTLSQSSLGVIGMALVSLQLLVGEEAAMEQYTGVAAVVAVEELLSA